MLGRLAAAAGLKTGFGILGTAVSGAYGALSGATKGIGALGSTLTSASQDLEKESKKKRQDKLPSNVIIGNFGMAGSAGKQKVIGSGTLPPLKNTQKPSISEKMPTEALMDTAVKYLTSIDKSLKAQLEFEKRSYDQQTRDEREAIIEDKKSFNFSDIKDRLSGFKSSTQDAAGTLATLAKYAAGLGLAAALVASSLDDNELTRLRDNIDQFKEKFKWLSDLGDMIPSGGFAGFLVGLLFGKGIKARFLSGVKGGLLGILSSAIADVAVSRATGGEISEDTKSILNIGAAAGIGYLGYRGIKSASRLSTSSLNFVGNNFQDRQARLNLAKTTGPTFRSDIDGKRYGSTANFFSNPRWRNFVAWLAKKGKRQLVLKIQRRIAIAIGSAALAASGVGTIVGVLGIFLSVFGNFFLAYEIYKLWEEWTSVEKAEQAGVSDAEIAKEINNPDATPTRGAIAGAPALSDSQRQNLDPIPADVEKILAAIRTKESGGNYAAQNPVSTASGAYQFIDSTWRSLTSTYGIGTEYPKAKLAPPEIQDAVAAKYVQDILKEAGGDVSKVPVKWYTGNIRGESDVVSPSEVASYQRDWMQTYDGGKYASSSYSPSGGDSVAGKVASASIDTVAKLFGTLGSAVIKPGVRRTDLMGSTSNASEVINNESMKIQNDISLGIKKTKAKEAVTTPATPGVSPSVPQPMKSISNMDPNYRSLDVLSKYLGHFKMDIA
jgi:hypothetical protein